MWPWRVVGGIVGGTGSTRFVRRCEKSSGCRCDRWSRSLTVICDEPEVAVLSATKDEGDKELDAFLELCKNGNQDCPSKNANDEDSCRLLVALIDPTVAADPDTDREYDEDGLPRTIFPEMRRMYPCSRMFVVSFGSIKFADAAVDAVAEDGDEGEGGAVVVSLGLEEESLESSSSVGEEGVDCVVVGAGARLGASLEAGRISIL